MQIHAQHCHAHCCTPFHALQGLYSQRKEYGNAMALMVSVKEIWPVTLNVLATSAVPGGMKCRWSKQRERPPLCVTFHRLAVSLRALDSHPFFPSHAVSGDCVLPVAAASARAGVSELHVCFPLISGTFVCVVVYFRCAINIGIIPTGGLQTTPQQPAQPRYANYWAPLTHKQHPPQPAQPRYTNDGAP